MTRYEFLEFIICSIMIILFISIVMAVLTTYVFKPMFPRELIEGNVQLENEYIGSSRLKEYTMKNTNFIVILVFSEIILTMILYIINYKVKHTPKATNNQKNKKMKED